MIDDDSAFMPTGDRESLPLTQSNKSSAPTVNTAASTTGLPAPSTATAAHSTASLPAPAIVRSNSTALPEDRRESDVHEVQRMLKEAIDNQDSKSLQQSRSVI